MAPETARTLAARYDTGSITVPDHAPNLNELQDGLDPSCRPATIHRSDLLFTPMTARHTISNQLYPYHQQAFAHSTYSPPATSTPPNLYPYHPHPHRSTPGPISPPPLPPKPILYPSINPSTSREDYQVSRSPPPLPPLPLPPPALHEDEVVVTSPTEHSDELAMVLALSQSESVQKRLLEEQLRNQEEEDLARALAASMLPNTPNETPESKNALGNHKMQASPSHMPLVVPPNNLPSIMPGRSSEKSSGPSSKLAVKRSSVSELPYNLPGRGSIELPKYFRTDSDTSASREISFLDLSSDLVPGSVLESDDATHARQLVAEEGLLKQSLHSENNQQHGFVNQAKSSTLYGKQNAEWHHPQYEELYGRQCPQDLGTPITSACTSVSTLSSMVQRTHSPPPVPDYQFPPVGRANSYQSDIQSRLPENQNLFAPVVYPSLGSRRGSASDSQSDTNHNSSPLPPHTKRPQLRLDMPQRPAASDARRPSQSRPPQAIATTSATTLNHAPLPSAGLNVNCFLDHELLRGVSIGFKCPMISTRLIQMQDQMPNIISLPYARCPPLHFQAPDWRHLLRLMARLSGTRIEPTVEAMAVSKTELKLRTVIQFVKPNASYHEWRSVLWFTIDQPVPSSFPGASRYTCANPNLLPWSYTLSPIPVLLRDASDTNMSKTYTIPATDTIPLPTLPITFPNLALYLQAALDTSRRHLSDSPNGLGKLGKMVQICYPSVDGGHSEYDKPERTTVGHLFKRVIGRGSKDKKNGKGTNNEETYQLVTPFVPDEWG